MNWKRVLLIGLVASGLAFVPVQRSDAQVSIGIGFGGYGYPGFYGYYPYGYYRPYPYYGSYYGSLFNWHNVHRHYYYLSHRHHYYHRYCPNLACTSTQP